MKLSDLRGMVGMGHLKRDIAVLTIKLGNVALITLPFLVVWFHFYADRTASPFYYWGNWIVVALFLALYVTFGRVYDGFQIATSRISEMVYSQVLAFSISTCILYAVTCLLSKRLVNPFPYLAALLTQGILSAGWSYLSHRWFFSRFPAKKTAVIYDARQGLEQLVKEYGLEKRFNVRIAMSVRQALVHIELLDDMETVFLSGIHSHDRNILLKYCVDKDINVYVIPRIGDVIMSGAQSMHMFHLPMLRVGRYHPSPVYLFLKRGFDILASGLATVILSPVFLVTAIPLRQMTVALCSTNKPASPRMGSCSTC